MHEFTKGTSEERRILHNLALRLRWARQYLARARRDCYPELIIAQDYGVWLEAHNSFQAAKSIVYFGED